MKKKVGGVVIVIVSVLIVGLALAIVYREAASGPEKQQAMAKAQQLFGELKEKGTDFSAGPCIADELMPDWVADVAHSPRSAADNLDENQCSSFRQGKAHHFVELDTEGKVVRVR